MRPSLHNGKVIDSNGQVLTPPTTSRPCGAQGGQLLNPQGKRINGIVAPNLPLNGTVAPNVPLTI